MIDKEKQIKEMEYDISYVDNNGYYYDEDGYQQDAYADSHRIAEELIKKGWVKLSKDNVVLLKSEYEKLQTDMRRLAYQNCNLTIENKNLKEDLDIEVLKNKETAEKYFNAIIEILKEVKQFNTIDIKDLVFLHEKNKEIAKQFGVEIKEQQ